MLQCTQNANGVISHCLVASVCFVPLNLHSFQLERCKMPGWLKLLTVFLYSQWKMHNTDSIQKSWHAVLISKIEFTHTQKKRFLHMPGAFQSVCWYVIWWSITLKFVLWQGVLSQFFKMCDVPSFAQQVTYWFYSQLIWKQCWRGGNC